MRQSQRCSSEGIDCSLRNTTLKPLKTKIQCYSVLIYSTCNQIKTSSWSSSYYALVYLSMCVLVIFSGRAVTVVLQKNHNNKHTLCDLILQWNLCGDLKANFSIGFILFMCNTILRFIPPRQWKRIYCFLFFRLSHEIIRMLFSVDL